MRLIMSLVLMLLVLAAAAVRADAATTCTFTTAGTIMVLEADCTTDETIAIPDGFTLDGNGNTITATDPPGGHFLGAVVRNAGASASVYNLTITTLALANVCDPATPDTRLRGILFDGASGVISGNTVTNINQGASGCQEGNAIEVRNAPFDGTHPNTMFVEISHNLVSAWQKTGIVANGDVQVTIAHNAIGPSATQANLAANSIQLGFGATGLVEHNHIAGNSWCCTNFAATAVLLFESDGAVVRWNNIMEGNADVGIYVFGDGVTVNNNRVFEAGEDGLYDIGIGNYGLDNEVTNNKVRGFATAYDGVVGGNNKTIPRPHDP